MLDQNTQDTLQQIANKHHVEIIVTRPGTEATKWSYRFTPPVPQQRHNDAPQIGFTPPTDRTPAD